MSRIDRQVTKASNDPRIPVVTPTLHLLSMTVVVFLRRNFGYDYLRPFTNFITLTWLVFLFSAIAWSSRDETTWWQYSRSLCIFLGASLVLYYLHWFIAYLQDLAKKGPHGHYVGSTWLFGDKSDSELSDSPGPEYYIEPLVVFLPGAFLYSYSAETVLLGVWLMVAATALSVKEYLNHWNHLQVIKSNRDALKEADGNIGKSNTETEPPLRSTTPQNSKPNPKSSKKLSKQRLHYACLLNLEPPYTAEKANKSYLRLVKEIHPDSSKKIKMEDHPKLSELREALEFFRTHNA
ncbi:MAG: J domain-containing protein [Verrucomicrobiota bacterium]